ALAAGWTETPARDTGYRMSVCGVDLEPNEPVDSAQANWRKGEAGPALEQHVRVYADDTAQKVVTALAEALPDCREYTAEDDGGRSAFTVEPFEVEDAVAWRQRVMVVVPGTSDVAEVVQDVAVRRVGASVVLFNSYAVGEDPDRSALTAAVASLP
ncbi:MAG: hypothetical protein Q4G43_17785, partial [Mobilicoccus sp.]|nr:hypothetical protein [Mobilicoccus sp.]